MGQTQRILRIPERENPRAARQPQPGLGSWERKGLPMDLLLRQPAAEASLDLLGTPVQDVATGEAREIALPLGKALRMVAACGGGV